MTNRFNAEEIVVEAAKAVQAALAKCDKLDTSTVFSAAYQLVLQNRINEIQEAAQNPLIAAPGSRAAAEQILQPIK